MIPRWIAKPSVIWAILCALTLLSVGQIEAGWWRAAAAPLVVVIAGLKAHLVMRHYMETGRARPVWRLLYAGWVFAASAALIVGYAMSTH
jgi:Prokaryotic Cytochrome C oxidase subunit IV